MNMKYFMNHKLMNHKGFQEFLEKAYASCYMKYFQPLLEGKYI